MKKQFNPEEWLPKKQEPQQRKSLTPTLNQDAAAAVERALQALEATHTDATNGYAAWRDIGFALAEAFNESGRDYYHRVSRFHPEYSAKECDAQYDRCLKSGGTGIGLGSFFHHVKQAGVSLKKEQPLPFENPFSDEGEPFHDFRQLDSATAATGVLDRSMLNPEEAEELFGEMKEQLPIFPEELYEQLPLFLQKAVATGNTPEERDILLLGTLTTLSACLQKVFGIYDRRKVLPNLYLYVTAPASAGKGQVGLCRNLVMPIHRKLREEVKQLKLQYETDLAQYNASKNGDAEKPVKPAEKMLFIPANNSATGVFQLLFDNGGRGLLFEAEGDTMAQSFKSDYGNYSDGFRKGFHHETISYYRRTEREYVDLEEPSLSTVLTGTPRQVGILIPSAENGLFSRFMFYYMNLKPQWKDVFATGESNGIDEHYLELGAEFQAFHQQLEKGEAMRVYLTQQQRTEFNAYFSRLQDRYLVLQPQDFVATVRRLGLICFRLCMLFTALRRMEPSGTWPAAAACEDRDFRAAMQMIAVLIKHSSKVYYNLPQEKRLHLRNSRKERFLDALPSKFSHRDFLEVANSLSIPSSTAANYMTAFVKNGLVLRDKHDAYTLPEEDEEEK